MVGLLPLLASLVLEDALVQKLPGFKKRLSELLQSRPDLANQVFYIHIDIDSNSLTALVDSYRQNIINNTAMVLYKELSSFALIRVILSDLSP